MGIRKLVQSQGRVVVADFGEPVHMHRKDKNGGGGSSIYQVRKRGGGHEIFQKKDEKFPSPTPQLNVPSLVKLKSNSPRFSY